MKPVSKNHSNILPSEKNPDNLDFEMRIRDKDIVFIYEIDDIIKEMTSSDKNKPLDEHPQILDTLNRYSKLFRHYIRYRVVDIGDLVGGLFLDGFWKTLLITIDKILQSIDNRFKKRVVKLQQQYSKIIEQMHQKIEEKDQEMKAMDQSEYIDTLKQKLNLIKDEKLWYQKLAQDKLDFIEMLTSNEKKYPGFTGAKDLYDTARELIESMHLEKKHRNETVSKLDDIFETGKKVRKTQNIDVQTDVSYLAPLKIKEIVLPTLDDHQVMSKYNHPFANVLKFLNQETSLNEKKLNFKLQPMDVVFNQSETILNRIGEDLLKHSLTCEEALASEEKKRSRGRPKSAKRKKKKAKAGEGLALSFFRTHNHYPDIETIYIQEF